MVSLKQGLLEIDLGIVNRIVKNKDSGITNFPMPMSDSSDALQMDIMGANRTISISGIKTGTAEELQSFEENLDKAINGQQTQFTFEDRFGNVYKVLIRSFNTENHEGRPNEITYTLELNEGVSIL